MKPTPQAIVTMSISLTLIAVGGSAFAQDLGGAPPALHAPESEDHASARIDALAAAALDKAPGVAALRERLQAAGERITAAAALPDPMLELTLQDVGVYRFNRTSSFLVEYRQDLPFPGKRGARRASAEAEAAVNRAELEDLQRKVVLEIKRIFAGLYALDAERRNLESARELLMLLTAAATARYSAGESDREAVLKARLEESSLGARLDDIRAERETLVAALTRLMGSDTAAVPDEAAKLPEIGLASESPVETALANSSEIAVRQAYVKLSEDRLFEARLDLKPDFTLSGGAGMDAMPQPMLMLRLGMQLPLWSDRKQEPLSRSARHEFEAARQELRDAQNSVRANIARLAAQRRRDETVIARLRREIIPQAGQAMEAARSAYLTGRGDFSAVIDDFRRKLEAETEAARREADRYMVWAEIEAITIPMAARVAQGGER